MSLGSCSSKGSTPKKVAPFANTSFSRAHYEASWHIVSGEINNIFYDKPLTLDYTNISRKIKCYPKELSNEIFDNLRKLCLTYVNHLAPALYEDKNTDEVFLNDVSKSWQKYLSKMEILRRIFLFIDCKYWSSKQNSISFWDMAMHLWRDMLISTDLLTKIISFNLRQVNIQRSGNSEFYELTKSTVEMLKELGLYNRFWETKYKEEACQFFLQDCAVKQVEFPDVRYLKYVTDTLDEENKKSMDYLVGESMQIQLRDALVNIIFKPQLDSLLTVCFEDIMKDVDFENLKTLYSLTELIHGKPNDNVGVVCLKNYFKNYLMKLGLSTVENSNNDVEKDKKMTQDLLDLKDNMDKIINECFKCDIQFQKTVRKCFEQFVNSRPNKPAEYLAKFLDSKLRAGNKNMTEEAMSVIMDKVMTLFRFITGKDVFEAFYLKDLAKRLLMGKSACVDTEKTILAKLKQECGPNYTRKMEIMFSDIDNSQRLNTKFRQSPMLEDAMDAMDSDSPYKDIEMNLNVICNATWPTLGSSKSINLPPDLLTLQDAYRTFYNTNYNGRKLKFESYLGNCVVKAHFPKGRKELQVSEIQCMVLMQFNGQDDVVWSFQELEDALKIETEELRKTVLSLSVGKGQKVLLKKPMTTVLEISDKFSFNDNFEHKLTKIKFNQIQVKETKEEQKATEEQVFINRQSHLDCCIVKIMKSKRKIEHTALMTEVIKELKFPIQGLDIKKRIEHLIDRDFISRDEENPAVYNYVA